MKNLSSKTALLALLIVSLLLITANNLLVKGARVDLTENKLYSVSEGTDALLENLQADVELRFYYSERDSSELGFLRDYARRVIELLEEYEIRSAGRLSFSVLDPDPFSEQEEQASALGLQRITVGPGDPPVYFGLVAIGKHDAGVGNEEVLNFLHPDREKFLEYDISKMLYKAGRIKTPEIGMISTLQISGGADPVRGGPMMPWTTFAQLRQLYPITDLGLEVDDIPAGIDLLWLVHPKNLSDRTLYAIDQFALRGGKILLFADDFAQADPTLAMAATLSVTGEAFNQLLQSWGIKLEAGKVLADSAHALRVGGGPAQRPTPHLAVLGLGQENFPRNEHPILNQLDNIIFSSAGVISPIAGSGSVFEPLVQSSTEAALIESSRLQNLSDPSQLLEGFSASGERYTLVAHVTGSAKTAYPDGRPVLQADDLQADEKGNPPADTDLSETQPVADHLDRVDDALDVFIVADTDLLNDPLWVRVSDFFGQSVADPFADNGNFFINAAENMLGSTDLMNLRSRGTYARPFHVVERLEREAVARFQSKEQELQTQLQETESRLAELQQNTTAQKQLDLNAQQKQEVLDFRARQLAIRKELRKVQHQLGEDIEQLGGWIKLVNITLVPLLITIVVLVLRRRSRKLQRNP